MPAVVEHCTPAVALGAEPSAGTQRLEAAGRVSGGAGDARRDEHAVCGRWEPARKAGLADHGDLTQLGQQAEEDAHRPRLECKRRRQLHQQHGEPIAEAGGFGEKALERFARPTQAPLVREGSRQLDRKAKARRVRAAQRS